MAMGARGKVHGSGEEGSALIIVLMMIAMLGVLLIVLGVAGLFLSRVTWTETKPVVKVGPLQVNAQEDHTIWIPTAAGIAAVLAGVGLVFAGKKTA